MTWLGWVFLALLFAHTAQAVYTNIREAGTSKPSSGEESPETPGRTVPRRYPREILLQAPMFYIACYFAFQQGVFSRELVSPFHIGLGLAAGHLVFGASLLITHRCFRDAWSYFVDFSSLWAYLRESPLIIGRFLLVGFSEELIWRVAAQPLVIYLCARASAALLGGVEWPGVMMGIGVVALLFAIAHRHFFENTFMVSLEFLGFAILLGVLYYLTSSFILVVVIHAMRDIEITFLEYLIKLDELGDEEEAARVIEQSVLKRPRPERS